MKDTRKRIVETAFLLFLRKGFKKVRLVEIEKAARISKGTFYYHFSGKGELLKEGVEAYYAMLNERRVREFAEIQSLRQLIDRIKRNMEELDHFQAVDFTSDIPEILCLTLLVEVLSLYPEYHVIISNTKTTWLTHTEAVIAQAQESGEIRKDIHRHILAENLLNISVGVINYIILKQDMNKTLNMIGLQYEQLYTLIRSK